MKGKKRSEDAKDRQIREGRLGTVRETRKQKETKCMNKKKVQEIERH